jgi:hypothetical protein
MVIDRYGGLDKYLADAGAEEVAREHYGVLFQWTHNLGRGATFHIELDRNDDGTYEELIAAAAPADSASRGTSPGPSPGPPRPRPACASRGPTSAASPTPAT